MKPIHWLGLFAGVALSACAQPNKANDSAAHSSAANSSTANSSTANNSVNQAPLAAMTTKASALRIESHMAFLASDSLEGRETGSQGHLIASEYIASHFKQLGLTPAGDGKSFFQAVPLKHSLLQSGSASMVLHQDGKDITIPYPKHFFTGPSSHQGKVDIKAPLVFAGYGLVSNEFGIDDYAGLDVKGKLVVLLSGRPEHLPSEEAAHLMAQKQRLAAERGAVGIITLHSPKDEKVRPYNNSLIYLNAPRVRWMKADGSAEGDYPQFKGSAYLHPDAATQLFNGEKQSLQDIFAAMEAKKPILGFALRSEVSLSRQSNHKVINSQNVAAVLEGSDPKLKDEYVILTAHSDHIGVGVDLRSKDKINNGLMDNAAGVAILLETARLLAEAPVKPKRSVIFLAVTGEEKGLLGADYFAHHPTRPLSQLVANVNLDMPVLLYPFADMVAFGANHSSLGAAVDRATAQNGIKLSSDPMPEQAIFTRSDHYTLVKKGIPAVFLMTGFTSQDKSQKGSEVWGSFFAKHYHKPSDDIPSLTKEYGAIRYDFGALFADINLAITLDIANNEQRPYWLESSYFGKVAKGSN